MGNDADAQLIRSCFTGIYPLDNSPEGEKALKMGMETPDRFVLKPQREGGGHNYYGDQVREKLKELSPKERSGYILMERISPPPYKNVLVRQGVASELETVSELGIYGVFIWYALPV